MEISHPVLSEILIQRKLRSAHCPSFPHCAQDSEQETCVESQVKQWQGGAHMHTHCLRVEESVEYFIMEIDSTILEGFMCNVATQQTVFTITQRESHG